MSEAKIWFDLDLARVDDEALVVLAEECAYQPARDTLILRYRTTTDCRVAWLARLTGLGRADIEDAQQNAFFWIVEAIQKYDTEQIGKLKGCSFHSFMYRVLVSRLKDFTKRLRRVERHFDRQSEVDNLAAIEASSTLTDPAKLAEDRESVFRLRKDLGYLDPQAQRLWRLLAAGYKLMDVATELGISYDSVKRRRRKLIGQLKLRLK